MFEVMLVHEHDIHLLISSPQISIQVSLKLHGRTNLVLFRTSVAWIWAKSVLITAAAPHELFNLDGLELENQGPSK